MIDYESYFEARIMKKEDFDKVFKFEKRRDRVELYEINCRKHDVTEEEIKFIKDSLGLPIKCTITTEDYGGSDYFVDFDGHKFPLTMFYDIKPINKPDVSQNTIWK